MMVFFDMLIHGLAFTSFGVSFFFGLAGILGFVRFPDIYARTHALGLLDTSFTLFFLLGLFFYSPTLIVAFKVLFLCFLIWYTSPIFCQAFIQTAILTQNPPTMQIAEDQ